MPINPLAPVATTREPAGMIHSPEKAMLMCSTDSQIAIDQLWCEEARQPPDIYILQLALGFEYSYSPDYLRSSWTGFRTPDFANQPPDEWALHKTASFTYSAFAVPLNFQDSTHSTPIFPIRLLLGMA
jgi:hypothetical protein